MARPVDRDKIEREIAEELGLTEIEVRQATRHQFRYVQRVMAEGTFDSVRLPYFGKFHVEPGRRKNLEKNIYENTKGKHNDT